MNFFSPNTLTNNISSSLSLYFPMFLGRGVSLNQNVGYLLFLNNKGLLINGRPCPPPTNTFLATVFSVLFKVLPDSSSSSFFFFYLQIRSAVMLNNPHLFTPCISCLLYKVKLKVWYMLEFSYPHLPLDRVWRKHHLGLDAEFDVWVSIGEASHDPDHRQIQLTPLKLYNGALKETPLCSFCELPFMM